MLILLTGNIQTGKTRWLQKLLSNIEERGMVPRGVIAPGVWIKSTGPQADANGFEKLGIDNELLPSHEKVPFARRRDLAEAAGDYDEGSQSAQAQLLWAIDDSAIETVNAHFAALRKDAGPGVGPLVIDELGRLELLRGEGLTEAMALLASGPSEAMPVALVIVREQLVELAEERFAEAWGGCTRIYPDNAGRSLVLDALGLT